MFLLFRSSVLLYRILAEILKCDLEYKSIFLLQNVQLNLKGVFVKNVCFVFVFMHHIIKF